MDLDSELFSDTAAVVQARRSRTLRRRAVSGLSTPLFLWLPAPSLPSLTPPQGLRCSLFPCRPHSFSPAVQFLSGGPLPLSDDLLLRDASPQGSDFRDAWDPIFLDLPAKLSGDRLLCRGPGWPSLSPFPIWFLVLSV